MAARAARASWKKPSSVTRWSPTQGTEFVEKPCQHWFFLERIQIVQAIDRSRGGLVAKINACVDALENPLRLIPTGGQEADVTLGAALGSEIPTRAVIAAKRYDSDVQTEIIKASGAQSIIQSQSKRTIQRKPDWHRYKARSFAERLFNRLKQFHRLATRYDKHANRFNACLNLACAYIWLP